MFLVVRGFEYFRPCSFCLVQNHADNAFSSPSRFPLINKLFSCSPARRPRQLKNASAAGRKIAIATRPKEMEYVKKVSTKRKLGFELKIKSAVEPRNHDQESCVS